GSCTGRTFPPSSPPAPSRNQPSTPPPGWGFGWSTGSCSPAGLPTVWCRWRSLTAWPPIRSRKSKTVSPARYRGAPSRTVQGGAAMSGAGHMALPDEDTLTFPRAWRSKIIPRRGRPTSQDFTLRPAPEPSVPQNQAFAELLAQPDSDPELVSATRQVLADHRQATPPGVAVLLLGQLQLDGLTASQQQAELDYW